MLVYQRVKHLKSRILCVSNISWIFPWIAWWFSIAMLVHQRVLSIISPINPHYYLKKSHAFPGKMSDVSPKLHLHQGWPGHSEPMTFDRPKASNSCVLMWDTMGISWGYHGDIYVHIYIYISHRIHGAGIYANMTGVYWW